MQEKIGHASPEILNAFPRSYGPDGLTAREAIGTGFNSVFSWRRLTDAQKQRLDEMIKAFGRPIQDIEDKLFADLTPGEQSLVLLLRALVKKEAPLIILDEPFAGMDEELVEQSKRFLDDELDPAQALIFISHFEEEIPDSMTHRLTLEDGQVVEASEI